MASLGVHIPTLQDSRWALSVVFEDLKDNESKRGFPGRSTEGRAPRGFGAPGNGGGEAPGAQATSGRGDGAPKPAASAVAVC